MNKPTVSVLIPLFNGEPYIARAVDSVLQQTYPDYEVIVVDDGSTDSSRERVPVHPRVRLIRQENHGIAAALKTGLEAARAGLIAFLDQDDLYYPDKLRVQVRELFDDPVISLTACSADFIDGQDRRIGGPAEPYCCPDRKSQIQALFLKNYIPSFSYVMVRRESLEMAGGFCSEYRAIVDYDLWFRLADRSRFGLSAVPLVGKRLHGGNFSSGRETAVREILNCLRQHRRRYPEIRELDPEIVRGRFDSLLVELYEFRRRAGAWSVRADDPPIPGGKRAARIRDYYRFLFAWLSGAIPAGRVLEMIRAREGAVKSPVFRFLLGTIIAEMGQAGQALEEFSSAQLLAAGRFPEALHNAVALAAASCSNRETSCRLEAVTRLAPGYRDARWNVQRLGLGQPLILTRFPFALPNRLFLF